MKKYSRKYLQNRLTTQMSKLSMNWNHFRRKRCVLGPFWQKNTTCKKMGSQDFCYECSTLDLWRMASVLYPLPPCKIISKLMGDPNSEFEAESGSFSSKKESFTLIQINVLSCKSFTLILIQKHVLFCFFSSWIKSL